MVDRTDIDALLIGALYGELTPADEARLTAHLESHPVDRTALDNLTRTRAAVRDSRILAFQFEPPHAISALLLQEASRRAPRAATARGDDGETSSWFHRFVRSFMAHPAMAAAAMLVLVITAAGTFYLRGADQFAKSEPPTIASEQAAPESIAPIGAAAPAAPATLTPEPEAAHAGKPSDPSTAPAGPSASGSAGMSNGLATGAPSVRVELDQAVDGKARAPTRQAAANDPFDDRGDRYARPPSEKAKAGDGAASGGGRDVSIAKLRMKPDASRDVPARAEKADRVRGIELRTPQLMPKDLQDGDDRPAPARRDVRNDGRASGDNARGRGAPGAGLVAPAAPAAGGAPPPSPAASTAAQPPPAPDQVAGPAAAPALEPAPAQGSPAKDAKRPAPRPVVVNKPSPPAAANNASNAQVDRRLGKTANTANTANADAAKQAEDKSARDTALLEWARKQREQVIALVGSNRCRDAASAAVEIYNRAPDYFNANIATDRQIRPCLAYVNDQRERADRSRAATKNAADVQAPAPTRK